MSKKTEEIKSLSKTKVLVQLIIMWGGIVMCLIGMFAPPFEIFGLSSTVVLNLPGGVFTLVGLAVMLAANKCPYCGSRKIGVAIGGKLYKEIECPACKKKVGIK